MTGHKRERVMSNEINSEIDSGQPMVYQIRIKGHLGREWTNWFEGLTIQLQDNGETLLTGPVVDQAALHGVLKKVRYVGMPLLSVNRVKPGQADASDAKQ
jgi:hypothetical protein